MFNNRHVYSWLHYEPVSAATTIQMEYSKKKKTKIVTINCMNKCKIYKYTYNRLAPSAKLLITCILLLYSHDPKLTQSRIIHIYRTNNDNNNSNNPVASSSVINNNSSLDLNDPSLETLAHQSPINRIMELMLYHQPVLVPASPPPLIALSEQQSKQSSFNLLNKQPAASFSPTSTDSINHQQQIHMHDTKTNVNNHEQTLSNNPQWTFLETPAVSPSSFGGHSFHSMNSYLIPSTNFIHSPSANLMTSGHLLTNQNSPDFSSFSRPSVVQSSLQNELSNSDNILNSVNSIPDSSGSTISSQPAINQDDQQLQPIFLSSYIPEIPVQQQPSQLQPQTQTQMQQQQQYTSQAQLQPHYQPGSIQQIQQMQQQQQQQQQQLQLQHQLQQQLQKQQQRLQQLQQLQQNIYQSPFVSAPNQLASQLLTTQPQQMTNYPQQFLTPQQAAQTFTSRLNGQSTGTATSTNSNANNQMLANKPKQTPPQTSKSEPKQQETNKANDDKDSNSNEDSTSSDNDSNGNDDSGNSNDNDDTSESGDPEKTDTSGSQSNEVIHLTKNPESPKRMDFKKSSATKKQTTPVQLSQPRSKPIIEELSDVGLNDDCLRCICVASTGCDQDLRCVTRGQDQYHCGPFKLTREYWGRGDAPGNNTNDHLAFEDCANELECAVDTVINYMGIVHKNVDKRYLYDCDGDGNITCLDYAMIHTLGPENCRDHSKLNDQNYWDNFKRCAKEGHKKKETRDESEEESV